MTLPKFLLIVVAIMVSQSVHAQWTNTGGPPSRVIQCFAVTDASILAGTDGGLVRSTDNGAAWANIGGGLPYTNIRALFYLTSYPFNVLTGMVNGRISQSTDYGSNWTGFPVDANQMAALADVNAIFKDPSGANFWVGTDRGVYLLPQYYPLSFWNPYNNGLPSGEYTKVRAIVGQGGAIFIGTDSGVFKLNGSSWDQKVTGLLSTNVTALAATGGYLIAGIRQSSNDGVYISSDNGEHWKLSAPITAITSILTVGSTIFVGSFGDGVWTGRVSDTTWRQINDGFAGAAYYVMSLAANDQFIFAGTNNANVWRRSISQVTAVAQNGTNLQPETFSLEQNFPNPFNPTTTIRYELPRASRVSLKVYNTLGQEVATLVNETKPAGVYTVQFDAAGLASGVYFYRMQAGNFVEAKKLVLLR